MALRGVTSHDCVVAELSAGGVHEGGRPAGRTLAEVAYWVTTARELALDRAALGAPRLAPAPSGCLGRPTVERFGCQCQYVAQVVASVRVVRGPGAVGQQPRDKRHAPGVHRAFGAQGGREA